MYKRKSKINNKSKSKNKHKNKNTKMILKMMGKKSNESERNKIKKIGVLIEAKTKDDRGIRHDMAIRRHRLQNGKIIRMKAKTGRERYLSKQWREPSWVSNIVQQILLRWLWPGFRKRRLGAEEFADVLDAGEDLLLHPGVQLLQFGEVTLR